MRSGTTTSPESPVFINERYLENGDGIKKQIKNIVNKCFC